MLTSLETSFGCMSGKIMEEAFNLAFLSSSTVWVASTDPIPVF